MKAENNATRIVSTNFEVVYKNAVLEFINHNPDAGRKDIRNALKKQYSWLYRHNRKWLEDNLPVSMKNTQAIQNNRVNWTDRDFLIMNEIKEVYHQLISMDKPVRITLSLMGKKIGKLSLLEHYIDKMPETKRYLDQILESVEEFQSRRIDYACKFIINSGLQLKKWRIIKVAGLRNEFALTLDWYIEKCIDSYLNEGILDEMEKNT